MTIDFDVQVTEKLFWQVGWHAMLRRWQLKLLASVLVGAVVVLDFRSGSFGAISICGVTAMGILLLLYLAYYVRLRRTIAEWKRLENGTPVHYRLNDETIRAQSNHSTVELKWTGFHQLVECRDFLLLCLANGSHYMLPRAENPADALDLIRQKVQELKLPVKRE